MATKVCDLPRSDGLLRQLQYGDRDMAMIDVSSDVITVNWTTFQTAAQFVDFAVHDPDLSKADALVCTAEADLDLDMDSLVRLTKDEAYAHTELWGLVRLDITETRSVAWERLPGGLVVVGFGDDTNCMDDEGQRETRHALMQLLGATGTSQIFSSEVVDSAVELSRDWQHRNRTDEERRPAVEHLKSLPLENGSDESF